MYWYHDAMDTAPHQARGEHMPETCNDRKCAEHSEVERRFVVIFDGDCDYRLAPSPEHRVVRVMTGTEVSRMIDMADCDAMNGVVKIMALGRDGELHEVKLGPVSRLWADLLTCEQPPRKVGVIHYTDRHSLHGPLRGAAMHESPGPAARYGAEIQPEAWISGQAVPVDAPGPRAWDCTAFALAHATYLTALADRGGSLADGVTDSDDLFREDPAAPAWVRTWAGPFTIRVTELAPADCDECETGRGTVSATHDKSCSLHPASIAG
jgi:hypothetical protein